MSIMDSCNHRHYVNQARRNLNCGYCENIMLKDTSNQPHMAIFSDHTPFKRNNVDSSNDPELQFLYQKSSSYQGPRNTSTPIDDERPFLQLPPLVHNEFDSYKENYMVDGNKVIQYDQNLSTGRRQIEDTPAVTFKPLPVNSNTFHTFVNIKDLDQLNAVTKDVKFVPLYPKKSLKRKTNIFDLSVTLNRNPIIEKYVSSAIESQQGTLSKKVKLEKPDTNLNRKMDVPSIEMIDLCESSPQQITTSSDFRGSISHLPPAQIKSELEEFAENMEIKMEPLSCEALEKVLNYEENLNVMRFDALGRVIVKKEIPSEHIPEIYPDKEADLSADFEGFEDNVIENNHGRSNSSFPRLLKELDSNILVPHKDIDSEANATILDIEQNIHLIDDYCIKRNNSYSEMFNLNTDSGCQESGIGLHKYNNNKISKAKNNTTDYAVNSSRNSIKGCYTTENIMPYSEKCEDSGLQESCLVLTKNDKISKSSEGYFGGENISGYSANSLRNSFENCITTENTMNSTKTYVDIDNLEIQVQPQETICKSVATSDNKANFPLTSLTNNFDDSDDDVLIIEPISISSKLSKGIVEPRCGEISLIDVVTSPVHKPRKKITSTFAAKPIVTNSYDRPKSFHGITLQRAKEKDVTSSPVLRDVTFKRIFHSPIPEKSIPIQELSSSSSGFSSLCLVSPNSLSSTGNYSPVSLRSVRLSDIKVVKQIDSTTSTSHQSTLSGDSTVSALQRHRKNLLCDVNSETAFKKPLSDHNESNEKSTFSVSSTLTPSFGKESLRSVRSNSCKKFTSQKDVLFAVNSKENSYLCTTNNELITKDSDKIEYNTVLNKSIKKKAINITETTDNNDLHKYKGKSENGKRKICPICSFITNFESDFFNHFQTYHNKQGSYFCSICFYENHSKINFSKHLENHLSEVYTNLVKVRINGYINCNNCRFQAKNEVDFFFHKVTHLPKQVYRCNKCQLKFKTEEVLKIHVCIVSNNENKANEIKPIEHVHKGSTNFKCYLCEATFVDRLKLKVHMLSHTNDFVKYRNKGNNVCKSDLTFIKKCTGINTNEICNVNLYTPHTKQISDLPPIKSVTSHSTPTKQVASESMAIKSFLKEFGRLRNVENNDVSYKSDLVGQRNNKIYNGKDCSKNETACVNKIDNYQRKSSHSNIDLVIRRSYERASALQDKDVYASPSDSSFEKVIKPVVNKCGRPKKLHNSEVSEIGICSSRNQENSELAIDLENMSTAKKDENVSQNFTLKSVALSPTKEKSGHLEICFLSDTSMENACASNESDNHLTEIKMDNNSTLNIVELSEKEAYSNQRCQLLNMDSLALQSKVLETVADKEINSKIGVSNDDKGDLKFEKRKEGKPYNGLAYISDKIITKDEANSNSFESDLSNHTSPVIPMTKKRGRPPKHPKSDIIIEDNCTGVSIHNVTEINNIDSTSRGNTLSQPVINSYKTEDLLNKSSLASKFKVPQNDTEAALSICKKELNSKQDVKSKVNKISKYGKDAIQGSTETQIFSGLTQSNQEQTNNSLSIGLNSNNIDPVKSSQNVVAPLSEDSELEPLIIKKRGRPKKDKSESKDKKINSSFETNDGIQNVLPFDETGRETNDCDRVTNLRKTSANPEKTLTKDLSINHIKNEINCKSSNINNNHSCILKNELEITSDGACNDRKIDIKMVDLQKCSTKNKAHFSQDCSIDPFKTIVRHKNKYSERKNEINVQNIDNASSPNNSVNETIVNKSSVDKKEVGGAYHSVSYKDKVHKVKHYDTRHKKRTVKKMDKVIGKSKCKMSLELTKGNFHQKSKHNSTHDSFEDLICKNSDKFITDSPKILHRRRKKFNCKKVKEGVLDKNYHKRDRHSTKNDASHRVKEESFKIIKYSNNRVNDKCRGQKSDYIRSSERKKSHRKENEAKYYEQQHDFILSLFPKKPFKMGRIPKKRVMSDADIKITNDEVRTKLHQQRLTKNSSPISSINKHSSNNKHKPNSHQELISPSQKLNQLKSLNDFIEVSDSNSKILPNKKVEDKRKMPILCNSGTLNSEVLPSNHKENRIELEEKNSLKLFSLEDEEEICGLKKDIDKIMFDLFSEEIPDKRKLGKNSIQDSRAKEIYLKDNPQNIISDRFIEQQSNEQLKTENTYDIVPQNQNISSIDRPNSKCLFNVSSITNAVHFANNQKDQVAKKNEHLEHRIESVTKPKFNDDNVSDPNLDTVSLKNENRININKSYHFDSILDKPFVPHAMENQIKQCSNFSYTDQACFESELGLKDESLEFTSDAGSNLPFIINSICKKVEKPSLIMEEKIGKNQLIMVKENNELTHEDGFNCKQSQENKNITCQIDPIKPFILDSRHATLPLEKEVTKFPPKALYGIVLVTESTEGFKKETVLQEMPNITFNSGNQSPFDIGISTSTAIQTSNNNVTAEKYEKTSQNFLGTTLSSCCTSNLKWSEPTTILNDNLLVENRIKLNNLGDKNVCSEVIEELLSVEKNKLLENLQDKIICNEVNQEILDIEHLKAACLKSKHVTSDPKVDLQCFSVSREALVDTIFDQSTMTQFRCKSETIDLGNYVDSNMSEKEVNDSDNTGSLLENKNIDINEARLDVIDKPEAIENDHNDRISDNIYSGENNQTLVHINNASESEFKYNKTCINALESEGMYIGLDETNLCEANDSKTYLKSMMVKDELGFVKNYWF